LSPELKGKIQSPGGRGNVGKKRKNEGTRNIGELLGYGERNEEKNEEEETRKKEGSNQGLGRKIRKLMRKKGLEREENLKVDKEGRSEGGRQNKNGKMKRRRKAG